MKNKFFIYILILLGLTFTACSQKSRDWTNPLDPLNPNYNPSSVYRSPGTNPTGLAWDGSNLWSCDLVTKKIYKHNMDSTLSVAGSYTYSVGYTSAEPTGLFYNNSESRIYSVARMYDSVSGDYKGYQFKHKNDSSLTIDVATQKTYGTIKGMAWDGYYTYSSYGSSVYRERSGITTLIITPFSYSVEDLIIVGNYLYTCSGTSNKVYKYSGSSSNYFSKLDTTYSEESKKVKNIYGLAWDGTYIWGCGNGGYIYKYLWSKKQ